jgi:hypothetical protein
LTTCSGSCINETKDFLSFNCDQYIWILTQEIGYEIANTLFTINDERISFLNLFGEYHRPPRQSWSE